MKLFSERYNYTHPSDVIIREQITPEIQNAICSCFDRLKEFFREKRGVYYPNPFYEMEKLLWTNFLNQRKANFSTVEHEELAMDYLEDESNPWYKKLDLVEFSINYLYGWEYDNTKKRSISNSFVKILNEEFERLNFAYRIIDKVIVEVTSEEEIKTIESALENSAVNIRQHLSNALELCSQRPVGDYRNSIKEAISAVEAYCREITGQNTLGNAFNCLEKRGVVMPKLLKTAFESLYHYTNQPDTGIRHALMDDNGTYTPASEEALFMLVSCSAFINYLNKKQNKH